MKIKKTIFLGILILASIIIIGTSIYMGKEHKNIKLVFQQQNQQAQPSTTVQGNYLVFCEANGVKDFPFVKGEKIKILSIPDGKEYMVEDEKGWLMGVTALSIQGNMIYWIEEHSGEPSAILHGINIESKKEKIRIADCVYNSQYAIVGKMLFYTKEKQDADDEKSIIMCRNIYTGDENVFLEGNNDFFVLKNEELYSYDKEKGILKQKLLNSKEEKVSKLNLNKGVDFVSLEVYDGNWLLLQTSEGKIFKYNKNSGETELLVKNAVNDKNIHKTIQRKGNMLYYCDDISNVQVVNMESKKSKTIIDWKSLQFSSTLKKGVEDGYIKISWCTDYIVAQIDYQGEKEKIRAIVAFDYTGQKVYEKQDENLKP